MKYQINLTDDDYLKFNLFYIYHSKSGKRSLCISRLVLPILSVALILLLFLTGTRTGFILTEAAVLAALSVIFYVRMPKIMQKNTRKYITRLKADGKLPYHAQSEIEFQDSMIVERHEQGELRLKYEDIENIYLENDYLYLFFSAVQAFIIPCRCLGADKERVIEFLMEKRSDFPSLPHQKMRRKRAD